MITIPSRTYASVAKDVKKYESMYYTRHGMNMEACYDDEIVVHMHISFRSQNNALHLLVNKTGW